MERVDILTTGFIVVDVIAAGLSKIPAPGDLVFAPLGVRLRIGGHPANISIDLMQMNIKEGKVGVVGAVGDDFLKDFVRNILESKGLFTYLQEVKGMETGKTVILVVRGEDRRYINEPGANLSLSFEHVSSVLKRVKPKIFYIASGLLGDFDFRVWELVKFCKENGIITIIDLVKPEGKDWNYIYPALNYSDIMHCNILELKGLSRKMNVKDGLRWLVEKGVRIPIISDGGRGVFSIFKETYIRQPAFKVKAVDPTGAGDALCAGIIFKIYDLLRSGKTLEDLSVDEVVKILLYGQAAGAACIGMIGATPGVTFERINGILDEQGEKVLSMTSVKKLKPV